MAKSFPMGRAAAALLLLLVSSMGIFGIVSAHRMPKTEQTVHTKSILSHEFFLGPGDVIDEYHTLDMPTGHIAIRDLKAQVVDKDGTPVPLYETYLHHWILVKYLLAEGATSFMDNTTVLIPNDGPCQIDSGLPQWFGLGSETRRTKGTLPPPYGIVTGDPKGIPSGFRDVWILNVHAIDTRGAVDVRRCTECLCKLYNATTFEDGEPIPSNYSGGLECCRDHAHCALKDGFQDSKRELYMQINVTWVDVTDDIVPVKVYILDVTDERTVLHEPAQCQVEYTVPKCVDSVFGETECIHTLENPAFLADGGDVIYAVAHQHTGGVGSALYNEDGKELCKSTPIYGDGIEAGNEDGYIVGMSSCFPEPGTVQIKTNEKLHHKSFYNNALEHTGVMGLFYVIVAPSQTQPKAKFPITALMSGLVAIAVAAVLILIGSSVYQKWRKQKTGTAAEYSTVPQADS